MDAYHGPNSDLRLIEIKRVFQPTAGGAPTVLDTAVPLPGKTAVTLSGSFTPTAHFTEPSTLAGMS